MNVTYFAQASSKHNNLVELAHFFQEVVNPGPLDNVHVVPMILNFNRNHVIGMLDRLMPVVRGGSKTAEPGLTLKLLCSRVSSRSSTRHLRPACCGARGGKSGRGTPSWGEMRTGEQ